jgi:predicted flap endonuclease-1-like 5' DNA nuclease
MTRWIRIGLIVLLVPILGGLVAMIFWWLIQRQGSQITEHPQRAILLPPEDLDNVQTTVVNQKRQADELQKIEGIGPKIASTLQDVGINTYAQIAVTENSRLKSILYEAGIRAAPDTWPDQAKLAAVGDWDGLVAFQDQLKGGRRA